MQPVDPIAPLVRVPGAADQAPRPTGARKVLIIEDNEDNRIIYAAAFRHRGYRVLEADNGYTGVELARRERPDVVLMDLSMPILDGFEATQALKHDPETSAIPVVIVSAHSMPVDEQRARDAGCSFFLVKPVLPLELVDEVARMLAPEASPTPSNAPIAMR